MKLLTNFLNVVIVFLIVIILSVNLLSDKFEEGILNYQLLQVVSDSMDSDITNYDIDTLKKDELIIVKKNNNINFFSNLKIGDVITFRMNEGVNTGVSVTHRITNILYDENTNTYTLTTKGDKNNDTETLNSKEDLIYGQVIYSNLLIGYTFNVIKNKYFLILTVITPCVFIGIYEIVNIYEMIKLNPKNKGEEK